MFRLCPSSFTVCHRQLLGPRVGISLGRWEPGERGSDSWREGRALASSGRAPEPAPGPGSDAGLAVWPWCDQLAPCPRTVIGPPPPPRPPLSSPAGVWLLRKSWFLSGKSFWGGIYPTVPDSCCLGTVRGRHGPRSHGGVWGAGDRLGKSNNESHK